MKTACPLPNWAGGQAFKNNTRCDALNLVCKLKAKAMETACPLINQARGQDLKNIATFKEMFKADISAGKCHQ